MLVLAGSVSGDVAAVRAQQPDAEATGETDEDSPLLKEPESPQEQLDAALLMVKLGRHQLARRYLENLTDADPNDEQLLELRNKFGPSAFLRLANIKALQPVSTRLLERVNTAFRKRGASSEYINGLIADLDGPPRKRDAAVVALRSGGAVVVPHMLRRLRQAESQSERDLLVWTLVRLGRPVVPPLLGALDAPDANLRAIVMDVLGHLQAERAVPHLWYPAFGPEQPTGVRTAARQALARILTGSADNVDEVSSYGAADRLKQTVRRHFRGNYPWETDAEGNVVLWAWIPQRETVGMRRVSPATASLVVGRSLARDALGLKPQDRQTRALYLGVLLASAVHRAGPQNRLPTGPGTAHDLALTLGEQAVAEALTQSLRHGNAVAAQAALKVLGQVGTRNLLRRKQHADETPLLAALNYPDPRVQFAAAGTVLQLDPKEPFPASGRVVAILARALNDGGSPRAVVIDANTQRGGTAASFLQGMGYAAEVVGTGQEGFRVAADRMDVELIAVEANVIRWPLSQTVANIRADARTAAIPIVIYGPEPLREEVNGLLGRHSLITYVVESSTAEHWESQVRPFLQSIRTPSATREQRSQRRSQAAYWFAHIAGGRRTQLYDIASAEEALAAAAADPDLAANALTGLGSIATRTAQRHLQKVAVSGVRGAAVRRTAALQLAFHIQRFGLLLPQSGVGEIREAWRNARSQNPDLATALASVIGSLKPDSALARERLQSFEPPRTLPQTSDDSDDSAQ